MREMREMIGKERKKQGRKGSEERKAKKKEQSQASRSVELVQHLLVRPFHLLAPDIALRRCPRQRLARHHDDHPWVGDPLVEVQSAMKSADPADDLLLHLRVVFGPGLRANLDEQGRGWTTVANDDALLDEMLALQSDVVFDGSTEITMSETRINT